MDIQDSQDNRRSDLQLAIARQEEGFHVQCQHPIHVHFRQRIVGEFYADLFVEEKDMVELKAAKAIAPEHPAQIINYLTT